VLKNKRLFFLLTFFVYQNFAFANLVDEGILFKNPQNNSCLVYQPFLGVVEDIESLDIKSDKFEITDEKVLILNGNVEIDFPDGLLRSGKARVDQDNGLVDFKKNGDLFLEDYFFRADEGSFNKDKLSIKLSNGETFLNDRGLVINFDSLEGNIENEIILNQVSMTSCSNVSSGWELIAEKIVLNDESKRGYAKNVKIKAFDKTIVRFPAIPFATSKDRTSGFLEPSLSYSSDGVDFMIPYYQVTSKKSDLTIAARNISERGLGLEGNIRNIHGKTNNMRNLDFIYFGNDSEYKELYPNQSDSRWAFNLKDSFGKSKNVWAYIDWSKASDSLVLRDISGEISSIGSERKQNLKQNVEINGIFKNIEIKVAHQGYQTLNPILTNGYKKIPSIDLKYFKSFKKLSIYEHINYSNFKAEGIHGFFGNYGKNNKFQSYIEDPVEGSRIFYDFELSNFSQFSAYQVATSIGLKSISYNLKNENFKTNTVVVPSFKLDISSLYLRKDGMTTHTLRPRIFYGYVGYENQKINPVFDTNSLGMMNQLFNTDRFAGMDRIGDQNFYTLSLEYKKRKMNMDKISLKVSQKFYQDERRVSLHDMGMSSMEMGMSSMEMGMSSMNMSPMMNMMSSDEGPLMIMGKWMPDMSTMIMTYGSYAKDVKKFPMAGITINRKFKSGKLGYAKRYKKMSGDFNTVLDYSEFFANFRLNSNYSLITKLKRDDDSDSKIESVLGIGYENCCFIFKITASDKNLSKYLDGYNPNTYTYLNDAWDNIIRIENKSRINFEFEFKGLNSSFEKVSRFMNNSILNY